MAEFQEFVSFQVSETTQVFRIPLQAFPKFWAFAYLVVAPEGLFLIDTGSGSEFSNQDLLKGFENASSALGKRIQPGDLTHILITHGHIDHMGGLVFLRERTHARVGVHELDLQTIARHEERLALMSLHLDQFLVEAGINEDERTHLLQLYKFTKAFFHSVSVDFTFESIGMHLRPFQMMHLPGHCAGQVAIRLGNLLFCGDHLLSDTTTHQSPERLLPFLGIRHYLGSLDKLLHWSEKSDVILAGHDKPITDIRGRVSVVRKSIQFRLDQCLDFLAAPHSLAEVTSHIYGPIGGYNALLTIEKAGAYLEYLYQHGLLEITNVSELEAAKPLTLLYRRVNGKTSTELLPKEEDHVFI